MLFRSGASSLIDKRADELESSFGPAKTKYKSYIQNAEATTTYWNDIQKNGGVDYLQIGRASCRERV